MRGRPSSNPLTVSPIHTSTWCSRRRSGFSRVESRSRTIWCRIVSNPRTVSPDPSREEAPAVTTVAATWRHRGHCWQKQKSKRKWRRLVPTCWFWTTLILWATKLWRNLHSLSPCERFLFIFKFSKNADFPKKNTKSPKPFSWCWRETKNRRRSRLQSRTICTRVQLMFWDFRSCPLIGECFPIGSEGLVMIGFGANGGELEFRSVPIYFQKYATSTHPGIEDSNYEHKVNVFL